MSKRPLQRTFSVQFESEEDYKNHLESLSKELENILQKEFNNSCLVEHRIKDDPIALEFAGNSWVTEFHLHQESGLGAITRISLKQGPTAELRIKTFIQSAVELNTELAFMIIPGFLLLLCFGPKFVEMIPADWQSDFIEDVLLYLLIFTGFGLGYLFYHAIVKPLLNSIQVFTDPKNNIFAAQLHYKIVHSFEEWLLLNEDSQKIDDSIRL